MPLRLCQTLCCTWSRRLYLLRQGVKTTSRTSLSKTFYTPCMVLNGLQRGLANGPRYESLQGGFREAEINDEEGYDDDDDGDDDGYNTDDFLHKFNSTDDRDAGFDKAVGRLPEEQWKRCSQAPNSPDHSRVLRVSIIGSPNSGKSTLINSLMGWKLNGVSSKVHTTEKNVNSVYTRGNTQIVFIDTPGVMTSEARKRHHCAMEMERAPEESVIDADIIGVIIDCADRWERKFHEKVLQILHDNVDKPSFLILNKTDLLKHSSVTLSITRQLTDGIVAGKPFGKTNVKKHSEKKTDNLWLDDEGFERLFSNLEQTYGRLDFLYADESKINSENEYKAAGISKDQTDLAKEKTNAALSTQLEEDSYQKDFLEEILSKQTVESDINVSSDEDATDKLAGSRIKLLEERKKRSLEFKLNNYWRNFDSVFPVSALTGDGMGYLVEFLHQKAKPSPWIYHSSVVTNQDPAEIAKMCVRQALLDNVNSYVPYAVCINITYWEVNENNRLDIGMEVVAKNAYEMNFLFGKEESTNPSPSAFNRQSMGVFNPNMEAGLRLPFKPRSLIVKVASQAKQALLDVFRCEIKFQLAIRMDKDVKRKGRVRKS